MGTLTFSYSCGFVLRKASGSSARQTKVVATPLEITVAIVENIDEPIKKHIMTTTGVISPLVLYAGLDAFK